MLCRICNTTLNDNNWWKSNRKCGNYICKSCVKQYVEIHKEEKREYDKNYRQIHKDEISRENKKYYQENKDEINERRRTNYKNNEKKREKIKNTSKLYYEMHKGELKLQVIEHYSNGTMQCNCCGENEIKFLQIDHIDCGNLYHGKNKRPHNYTGQLLYTWLIKNGFPNGYQVLCANCNFAKGMYGICPHKC